MAALTVEPVQRPTTPKTMVSLDAPRELKNDRGVRRALAGTQKLIRPTFSSSV